MEKRQLMEESSEYYYAFDLKFQLCCTGLKIYNWRPHSGGHFLDQTQYDDEVWGDDLHVTARVEPAS